MRFQTQTYNLPDGLWLLSFLLCLKQSALQAVAVASAIVHESAQAAGVTRGTFDWLDIAFYLLAAAVIACPRSS